MKAQVLESKFKRRKSYVIGFRNDQGEIYKSLAYIDPITRKLDWVDRPELAWNTHLKHEADKVLEYFIQYKLL
jgi:hypothetical protein